MDETYEQAVRAGAVSPQPPEDKPYGDRVAQVNDSGGNVWYIATHKSYRVIAGEICSFWECESTASVVKGRGRRKAEPISMQGGVSWQAR